MNARLRNRFSLKITSISLSQAQTPSPRPSSGLITRALTWRPASLRSLTHWRVTAPPRLRWSPATRRHTVHQRPRPWTTTAAPRPPWPRPTLSLGIISWSPGLLVISTPCFLLQRGFSWGRAHRGPDQWGLHWRSGHHWRGACAQSWARHPPRGLPGGGLQQGQPRRGPHRGPGNQVVDV